MPARRRLTLGAVLGVLLIAGCSSRYEAVARWNRAHGDPYPLDRISRDVPRGRAAGCPESVRTINYRGEIIRYATPVRVAADFAPKLRAFEELVAEVANQHYGRSVDRLLHFGARVCRSVRGRPERLSEHALGNALDVSGFQFDRSHNTNAFTVSVRKHWSRGSGPNAKRHAQFLRALVAKVIARGMFRGVVGPGHEGHADHFHFDQAPWVYSKL